MKRDTKPKIEELLKRIIALEKVVFRCNSCEGSGNKSYGNSDMGFVYEKCKVCKGTGLIK